MEMLLGAANPIQGLTAQIVSAHVGHNKVETDQVPGLVRSVLGTLSSLSSGVSELAAAAAAGPAPAVPAVKSVFGDYIVCLKCGKKMSMLKRHVMTAYGMTPEQYREHWGLPGTYPMVAPNYAKQRSAIAKETGLGKTSRPVQAKGSRRR